MNNIKKLTLYFNDCNLGDNPEDLKFIGEGLKELNNLI